MRHIDLILRAGAAVALGLPLAGCMLGPDYKRPDLDVPVQYRSATPMGAVDAAAVESAWWRQFNDPALDALISEGLRNNQDLIAAAARVEQFYGVLGTTRSALFPQVGAQVNGSRTRAS